MSVETLCLSFRWETGRGTQGAMMFIIASGCMLVSMRRGVFCQCACVTVVVRVSRVNGVIFVNRKNVPLKREKCAFEVVKNLLILKVMESVCV